MNYHYYLAKPMCLIERGDAAQLRVQFLSQLSETTSSSMNIAMVMMMMRKPWSARYVAANGTIRSVHYYVNYFVDEMSS